MLRPDKGILAEITRTLHGVVSKGDRCGSVLLRQTMHRVDAGARAANENRTGPGMTNLDAHDRIAELADYLFSILLYYPPDRPERTRALARGSISAPDRRAVSRGFTNRRPLNDWRFGDNAAIIRSHSLTPRQRSSYYQLIARSAYLTFIAPLWREIAHRAFARRDASPLSAEAFRRHTAART